MFPFSCPDWRCRFSSATPTMVGGRCGLLLAGRCRADLSGAELYVLHQFRLSSVGKSALQPVQFQPGLLVGVADHAGEGYHNYHHTFPRDYRNGPQWYNVDPSKWLIYTLSKLGLAEGLVRCDSSGRARIRPRNPRPADIGDIAGERVVAADSRLLQQRS